MAFTVSKVLDGDNVIGKWRLEQVTLQPAVSDYPSGGYVITAASCGLAKLLGVIVLGMPGGWVPLWNPSTGKLQVYQSGIQNAAALPLVELTALTNLAAAPITLLAFGY